MVHDEGRASIVVVMVMVVPFTVEPALAVERAVAVVPTRTVYDHVIVVTVMISVDVDVAGRSRRRSIGRTRRPGRGSGSRRPRLECETA